MPELLAWKYIIQAFSYFLALLMFIIAFFRYIGQSSEQGWDYSNENYMRRFIDLIIGIFTLIASMHPLLLLETPRKYVTRVLDLLERNKIGLKSIKALLRLSKIKTIIFDNDGALQTDALEMRGSWQLEKSSSTSSLVHDGLLALSFGENDINRAIKQYLIKSNQDKID